MLSVLNSLLFLISPFLALPTVLFGFITKSRYNLILFMLIIGVMSALYIPLFENDKARYYELYDNVKMMNLQTFFVYNYISNLDFVFQLLIYIASVNNINIQFVFFIVTFLTVGLYFNVFLNLFSLKKRSKKDIIFLVLLCLFSISLEDLFSGFRFMFASAAMLNAYYYTIFSKKRIWVIILCIFATLIHFSTLIFIIPISLNFILVDKDKVIRNLFLISIVFMFIPQSLLIDIFSKIGLSGLLGEKNDAYLGSEDSISNAIKAVGEVVRMRYFMYSIWIYLTYIYMYFSKNISEKFRNTFLLLIILLNVFWAFPTVFFRYSIFVKLVLAGLIIFEFEEVKRRRFKYLFLSSFFIIFFIQVMLMRYNFIASFVDRNAFFLYDILASEPFREYDFLK